MTSKRSDGMSSNAEHRAVGLEQLLETIETLRRECPWNMRQTPEELVAAMADEVTELQRAVDTGETRSIREEAGDVLFNLVSLLAACASDGATDLDLVAAEVSEKMRWRHPYVFGEEDDPGAEKAIEQWAALKGREDEARAARVAALTIHGSFGSRWTEGFGEAQLRDLCSRMLDALDETPTEIQELERSENVVVTRARGQQTVVLTLADPSTGAVACTGVRWASEVPPGWARALRRGWEPNHVWVMALEVKDGE